MKRAILMVAMGVSVVAAGCGDESGMGGTGGGGTGGVGGGVAPTQTRWAISNVTVIEDDCDFGELAGTFVIDTAGSDATMMLEEFELDASTDEYSPELTQVSMAGSATNEEFPPCVALLDDEFTLILDDPSASLPDNNTMQVEWDHAETDGSDGACEGIWFAPLPCAVAQDFTLTRLVE